MPNIADIYPLSALQEALLVIARSTPPTGDTALARQAIFELNGTLDAATFDLAWVQITERYPVLRTSFVWQRLERPLQVVAQEVQPPLDYHDWTAIAPTERDQRFETLVAQERARSFDVTRAPLWRLSVCRIEPELHRCVLTYHALVLDTWSIPTLVTTALDLCFTQADSRDALAHAPVEPNHAFKQYVLSTDGTDARPAERYWHQRFSGTTRTSHVPRRSTHADSVHGSRLSTQRRSLAAHAGDALNCFAERCGLSPSTLTLGAMALVLSRYSGTDDVVVGVSVCGRPTTESDDGELLGPVGNTLPIRINVAGSESIVNWLREITIQENALRGYVGTPMSDVLAWSELSADTALFDTCVILDSAPKAARKETEHLREPSPVRVEGFHREPEGTVDLSLELVVGLEPVLQATYDATRFDAEVIARLLGHVETVLTGFTADPERTVQETAILTDAESAQLLVEFNGSHFDAAPLSVQQLFQHHARLTPEAPALKCDDDALTYAQLNTRANQLAHWLLLHGVQPDTVVGLYLNRSNDLIVALLAILKAGGAYLPLDPAFPKERAAFMLADARAPLLITHSSLRHTLNDYAGTSLCLDTQASQLAPLSHEDPPTPAPLHTLAYVIYTSGSTGQPKGVLIEHASLTHYVQALLHRLQLPAASRFASVSTLAADLGNTVVFGALCSGGCLHLLSSERAMDAGAVGEYMQREGIDCLKIVPSHLSALLSGNAGAWVLPRRALVLGGEACAWSLVDRVRALAPECQVFNHYGPTETTVGVLTHAVTGAERRVGANVPLGVALGSTRVYVLDAYAHPVPIGAVGELYVGGVQVARGYQRREALTRERFVANPFGRTDAPRLYRTGDLVRWLWDGSLEFVGRSDDQVKIRGYRVELGEIESVLCSYPGVRAAVVLAKDGDSGERRLVGCVVCTPNRRPDAQQLREYLGSRLPDYMVPAEYVWLDTLPLSPNGKVDRQTLISLSRTASDEPVQSVMEPRTTTEEALATIWTELLGQERVGTHDNFFELGGHSLLAIQAVCRVRDDLGVEATIRMLFDNPTIAALGTEIDALRVAHAEPRSTSIPIADRKRDLPLSYSQQRLCFIHYLMPDTYLYNVPVAVRLYGILNYDALTRTLEEIVHRHEVLRTTFRIVDGAPVQVIAAPARMRVPLIDLSQVPARDREPEAERLATLEAQRPFDLGSDQVFRTTVLRLAEDDHVLLVTLHHIASDGWSKSILYREIGVLYQAFCQGLPSPLAPLPIQYADYASWQRVWMQGAVLEEQENYWRTRLAGAPAVLALPTDRPRSETASPAGSYVRFSISKSLADKLAELSRQEGATLFMTLLAAFNVLLSRYTRTDDIVVGTDVANRNATEVEDLIGFFLNHLVLRTDLSGSPTFRELLARVRQGSLEDMAHQDMPFDKLVEALNPERSGHHTPLFQILFVLQNAPRASLEFEGLTLSPFRMQHDVSKYDLSLFLVEGPESLRGAFLYRRDLFDNTTITVMKDRFETLLQSIVDQPNAMIHTLEVLSASEKEKICLESGERQNEKRIKLRTATRQAFSIIADEPGMNNTIQADPGAPGSVSGDDEQSNLAS